MKATQALATQVQPQASICWPAMDSVCRLTQIMSPLFCTACGLPRPETSHAAGTDPRDSTMGRLDDTDRAAGTGPGA